MQVVLHANSGGLGNRLRGMAGYKVLSELHGSPLEIFWESTPACDADFHDLFSSVDVNIIDRSTFTARKKQGAQIVSETDWYSEIWEKHAQHLTDRESFIKSSLAFLRSLKPAREVQSIVDNFLSEHPLADCAGVHIRRTDHAKMVAEVRDMPGFSPSNISQLDGFYKYVEELIDSGKYPAVFVCTDDHTVWDKLELKHGKNVITLNKSWRSQNSAIKWIKSPLMIARYLRRERVVRTTSIQVALADLILLSKCKLICGTYYSSFGRVAAAFGGVEYYHMLGDKAVKSSMADQIGSQAAA